MNKILSIIIISLLSISGFAQRDNIQIPNEPIEKIIFHTDRDLYISGEKLWFTANCFVTDKEANHNLSNILYIEIFNRSRDFIVKRKFSIVGGKAYGSIDIPLEFTSGNYFLRAYTQYLKNYQPENYFTSVVTVINPRIPLPEMKNKRSKNKIEIIPEGGILINGQESKVGVSLNAQIASTLKEITVVDADQNQVSNVNLNAEGFGLFTLTPDSSSYYFVKAITKENDTIIEQFPVNPDKGIFITSSELHSDNLRLSVVNKNLTAEKDYILVLKSNDFKTKLERLIELNDEVNFLSYAIKNLEEGLNYILIKNNVGEVVNVHSYIIKKDANNIDLSINTNKEVYYPREKVTIDFAPGNDEDIINMSVSVVKKGSLNYPDNIPAYTINNPQVMLSYMNSVDFYKHYSADEIDILMLYFNKSLNESAFITNILEKPKNEFLWIPETRDVSISGVVYNKTGEQAIANVPVYLSVFNDDPQFHMSKSNEKGEFIFSLNKLVDSKDVFICAKTTRTTEYKIKVNNDFSQAYSQLNEAPFLINNSHQDLLEEMFINFQAGISFKTETGKKEVRVSHFPFTFSEPQITVRLDDYVSTPSLEMAIREFVPAVKLHQESGKFSLSIFNNRARTTYHYPLVLVDNIPIFDINAMLEIPASKVKQIDVFKYPLILGDNFINGTFMLTTNTKDFGGMQMPTGSTFLEYQTISKSFAFDPQEYKNENTKNNRKADFRNLLYWGPSLKTNQKSSVSFYASDHCAEYDIIVRGITKDGEAFFKKSAIQIKN